ncbi:MAG: NAD(+) synthase [Bacteroidota bacterium]|nr:NAD(+) synthase [Bacteroidota bacterium]
MQAVKDFERTIKNIRFELEQYIQKNNLKSLVLGLSGGIDSALTAALAFDVCNNLNIPLIGRSLTIETNKPDEISRAALIGKTYTHNFKEVDLTKAYQNLQNFVVEDIDSQDKTERAFKIRMGNIKARVRMIYLYELASKNKGLVLSTDNLTELLLGFWTLHGDVGDYGMVQQLWKKEVYEISKYLADNATTKAQSNALNACIEAVPTDGLGITNSDLDQLQANSYAEVDKILIEYLETKNKNLENHPVISRHLASEYKRNNPLNLKREIFFK